MLSDLLNEAKGFNYQITVKVLLKKYQLNGEIEFLPFYFNSVTKTVINYRFKLKNSFQEILYMIDAWIDEGSGWIVRSIEYPYINISTYRSLSGSSYMNLPVQLRISKKKGLINIKSKDQNVFYGVMLGMLILQKNIQKEFENPTKKLLKNLIIVKLNLLIKKKILARLKKITIFASLCSVMKMVCFSNLRFRS